MYRHLKNVAGGSSDPPIKCWMTLVPFRVFSLSSLCFLAVFSLSSLCLHVADDKTKTAVDVVDVVNVVEKRKNRLITGWVYSNL